MNREKKIAQLETKTWDFIVIGGGASGLGIAVDAASRGFSTVLLERFDFGKGTSSRSTKLVHGGVRYLAQGNLKLVMAALRERGRLARNARHLFKNQTFVIPNYSFGKGLYYWIGLKLYDFLSGRLSLGGSRWIGKKKVLRYLPLLKSENLFNGVTYRDGQFDDARLAINLAQTAEEQDAVVLNYMRVIDLLKDESSKVCGVVAMDTETGNVLSIKTRSVINATGVFSNKILKLDSKEPDDIRVVPSQGIHLVLSNSFFESSKALMIPETTDGRVLFIIPWYDKVIVGTTDTPVSRADYEPLPLEEEIRFILENISQYLTRVPQREDVLSVFAGLRPLVASKEDRKNTKEISRGHRILVSPSKLISVLGGKWTTYRKMAEHVVNKAILVHNLRSVPAVTEKLSIHGNITNEKPKENDHLEVYGSDAAKIRKLWEETPEFRERIHRDYPYTVAEVVWSVRNEMARTVEDVLARRVRLLFLDAKAASQTAPVVAAILTRELHRDETWKKEQEEAFNKLCEKYKLN